MSPPPPPVYHSTVPLGSSACPIAILILRNDNDRLGGQPPMALSTRHRWCVAKIVEAFAPEVDDPRVQAFIRQEENHQKFTALFKGRYSYERKKLP